MTSHDIDCHMCGLVVTCRYQVKFETAGDDDSPEGEEYEREELSAKVRYSHDSAGTRGRQDVCAV